MIFSDSILKDKTIATVERKNDMEVEVMLNYTDHYGVPQITIMDECFYTNYLSYIANTGKYIRIRFYRSFIYKKLGKNLPKLRSVQHIRLRATM